MTNSPEANEAIFPFSVALMWKTEPSKSADRLSTSRLGSFVPWKVERKSFAGSVIVPATAGRDRTADRVRADTAVTAAIARRRLIELPPRLDCFLWQTL